MYWKETTVAIRRRCRTSLTKKPSPNKKGRPKPPVRESHTRLLGSFAIVLCALYGQLIHHLSDSTDLRGVLFYFHALFLSVNIPLEVQDAVLGVGADVLVLQAVRLPKLLPTTFDRIISG